MSAADLAFVNHGSVVGVKAMTEDGQTFIDDKVAFEGWQQQGVWIVGDHRPMFRMLEGAQQDGLVVLEAWWMS